MKKGLIISFIIVAMIIGFSDVNAQTAPVDSKAFQGSWSGLMPVEHSQIGKDNRKIDLVVIGSEVEMSSGPVNLGGRINIPARKDKAQGVFTQEEGLPCMTFNVSDNTFKCFLLPDGTIKMKLKNFSIRGVEFGETILSKQP
jgi:hypothetical protein